MSAHSKSSRPTRRRVVQGGLASAAMPFLTAGAFAQDANYPAREVRAICGFAAGSGADIFVRYFTEKMQPFLGGTIIVENRVGASGNIAVGHVARSKPDGYTILINAPSSIAAAMSLYKDPGYDAETAFDVLGSVCLLPSAVSVAPDSPHKTLQDLIKVLREKGDKASYGVIAPSAQVAAALMKDTLKLKVVEVPYRTAADSVNDLQSGAVDYMVYDPIFAIPRHRQGKLRVLALSAKERMTTAPDLPTMHESGVPGVDIVAWWGLSVPKGLPPAIRDKLSKAFLQMASLPATKAWLAEYGCDSFVIGPEQAQKRMIQDIEDWRRYVKLANLTRN
jgi:tripartite-type tricarboxylate transporter receptor subunit TctC